MKLYYIDDTMFSNSSFSNVLLQRFTNQLQHVHKDMVCISSTHTYSNAIHTFKAEHNNVLTILESPTVFDVEGIHGCLQDTHLLLEGFPIIQSFSGSYLEIDFDQQICQRIYLDLFPHHDQVDEVSLLMEHLEEMLDHKIKSMKKKEQRH